MDGLSGQLNSRDAALLTWLALALLWVVWSPARRVAAGKAALGLIQALVAPKIVAMVALVVCWQLWVVYLAAHVGLWDPGLLKETVVIVLVGGFAAGFKALALLKGEATWRGELQAVLALVVVVQWLANLETFPYVVEFALVPVAVLLGGAQAVATHGEEHKAVLPVLNALVALLGLAVLAWSLYRVVSSLGSTRWDDMGQSFALGFWLPAALLPTIYVAALAMQYGRTFSRIKSIRAPSLGARLDLYRHFGLDLRSLNAFARTPGQAHDYARAKDRVERQAVLREGGN